jgi:hypothetical protein
LFGGQICLNHSVSYTQFLWLCDWVIVKRGHNFVSSFVWGSWYFLPSFCMFLLDQIQFDITLNVYNFNPKHYFTWINLLIIQSETSCLVPRFVSELFRNSKSLIVIPCYTLISSQNISTACVSFLTCYLKWYFEIIRALAWPAPNLFNKVYFLSLHIYFNLVLLSLINLSSVSCLPLSISVRN